MTSHPYSHIQKIQFYPYESNFAFHSLNVVNKYIVMPRTEGDHNTWDRASSQVRKHIFFEENTYNQMAQKHSDGHVLWGDKWTLKNLKINTLYKRLGFSFNTWRIKFCLKCSDLLKEELWSIFWVVTKDWNSLPVKNRTEPTQRETW